MVPLPKVSFIYVFIIGEFGVSIYWANMKLLLLNFLQYVYVGVCKHKSIEYIVLTIMVFFVHTEFSNF